MRLVTAAVLLLAADAPAAAQSAHPFIPVGVVDDRPAGQDPAAHVELRKLRFNVVARKDAKAPGGMRLDTLVPFGTAASPVETAIPSVGVAIIPVTAKSEGADVRQQAWLSIARGDRGIVFDGWTTLRQNPDALDAAALFADVVTRNAALFAPLRPREVAGDVRLDVPPSVAFAQLLESRDVLALVAANLTDASQKVKMTFSPEMPEAIWQNMETGAAVNFVAGPDGPIYTATLAPRDVVVLTIRKKYK